MALYSNVTLGEMIEETLDILYRNTERPRAVILSSLLDAAGAVTTITLDADDGQYVAVSNVLEFGSERMLVTHSDGQANPTFTLSRAYAGTRLAEHPAGTIGLVDPKWGRSQIRRAILHCMAGPMARHVPYHATDLFYTSDVSGVGQQYVPLDANTLDVLSVRYMSPTNGRIVDLPGWRFENDLPPALVSSGRALRVPSFISTSDDLIVNYLTPYEWLNAQDDVIEAADVAEEHYVRLPTGAEDVPVLYAVAYLSSGRELTRQEVDRTEEWNAEMADRRGVNLQALRQAWQLYYQRIDEVHRVHPMPKRRVFRRWQQPF